MMTKMKSDLHNLLTLARSTGCPEDQMGLFLRAGYVPQPKQLQFHAAARLCDGDDGPKEIGFGGARGPGKSHALLAQMGLDDCQRIPGLKCLLLRRVGKAVRESFEDLRTKVLFGVVHKYRRGDGVLEFANGSRIILGHFKDDRDIDNYLGLEYDLIGVEEATTLSSSKYKTINTCRRTTKDDWRTRTYSNANPGGIGHAWYKQRFIVPYRDGRANGTRFIPGTVDDNVFVDSDYVRTLDDLIGWQKRAWRHGDWDVMAGQYFTNFNHNIHAIEPIDIPYHWRIWLAMDYGFVHWNIIYLLAQSDDGILYVVDEYAARRQLVPQVVNGLRAMIARHNIDDNVLADFIAGQDVFAKSGRSEATIAEQWAKHKFSLTPANMDRVNGAAAILARLGDVDNGIPPRMYIFKTCGMLLDCLPILEHNPRRPGDVLKVNADEDGIGGDDAYDALRYGVMAVDDTRGVVELAYDISPEWERMWERR